MMEIKRTVTINKPIKEVWKVLFKDFTKISNWATGIYTSRPGTKEEKLDRVCTTFTGKLYEKIISKDEENHTYEVDAKGLPFFVKSFIGRWNLQAVTDDVTKASFELKIQTKGIIGTIMQIPMKFNLKKGVNEALDDLIIYVESGKISSSKQKELSKK